MAKSLVIVESPAKARTIGKYLGEDFEVLASYGHVRDLLSKDGAVDVEHDFAMHYELVEKNIKHVDAIIKAMEKADVLYLATDPDREGEAIAWHLFEILNHQNLLVNKDVQRIVFHEITERAIVKAIANPRDLSFEMIHAQQARRALDYLVGFNLSPLLWRKIRRGLSAGRVQSPALRMIVEREQEIEQFDPKEYWFIEADLNAHQQDFTARLFQYQKERLQQFSVANVEDAVKIEQQINKAADGKLTVTRIEKKQHKRTPAAPFITSTLQQEAARKLGFGAQRTMRAAQQLYEGVDVGEGEIGLITYMRTDSVHLSDDAVQEIREYIGEKFGKQNLPDKPNVYQAKSKNAQEAHEAIRPVDIKLEPETIRKKLTADQYKLYELIWKRSIASQMIHAEINTVSLDLEAGDASFRTAGSVVASPGFMSIYKEDGDDVKREEEDRLLPPLKEGDVVDLRKIRPEQHFTKPPPRYTEASLVKALEEHDIGRPSTYAAIIYTLQQRDYVEMERKRFIPTDIGRIVNRFLTEHFADYVDYDYTAHLEDELDAIARGEKEWIPLMQKFWKPFKALIDEKAESVRRKDVTQELIEELCPECGKQLAIRLGRLGRFIGCTGFPECEYTRNLVNDGELAEPEILDDKRCPACNSVLTIRQGRYGKFIGCSNYPECKHIETLDKPGETGVTCPECKNGELLQRHSRNGKIFYSCSCYPDCRYSVWNEPLNEACPECHWPILTIKTSKRKGAEKVCPQKKCRFSAPYEKDESQV